MPSGVGVVVEAYLLVSNLVAFWAARRYFSTSHDAAGVACVVSGIASIRWHSCQHADLGSCWPLDFEAVGAIDYVAANILPVLIIDALLTSAKDATTPPHRMWMRAREGVLAAVVACVLAANTQRNTSEFFVVGTTTGLCVLMVVVVLPRKVVVDEELGNHYKRRWWAWLLIGLALPVALVLKFAPSDHPVAVHATWHVMIYGVARVAADIVIPRDCAGGASLRAAREGGDDEDEDELARDRRGRDSDSSYSWAVGLPTQPRARDESTFH
jgi:hypothetical protein